MIRIEATIKVGIPIIDPYFIKSKYEYLISLRFRIFDHIMPAKAPTGVKMAPMLDPMIAPKTALNDAPSCRIDENNTLIGMLFRIFANKADVNPYTRPSCDVIKPSYIFVVTP